MSPHLPRVFSYKPCMQKRIVLRTFSFQFVFFPYMWNFCLIQIFFKSAALYLHASKNNQLKRPAWLSIYSAVDLDTLGLSLLWLLWWVMSEETRASLWIEVWFFTPHCCFCCQDKALGRYRWNNFEIATEQKSREDKYTTNRFITLFSITGILDTTWLKMDTRYVLYIYIKKK